MRTRLLAHPYFTGACLVLALNDQVFKRLVPGAVTGKLSDVAGVFAASVAVSVLTARPRLSRPARSWLHGHEAVAGGPPSSRPRSSAG